MLHLKLFHAVEQEMFYKVAKIHSDIFWPKLNNRENDGQIPEFIKNMPAASVLKCIFITVLG